MNLPKSMVTRRSFLKQLFLASVGLVTSGGLLAGYTLRIEPRWLGVKQVKLTFDRLPATFHGKRIVHFSDIHIGHHFDLEKLRDVTAIINKQQPDMVCFTGDLFDSWVSEDPIQTGSILSELKAPLGKWAVLGNHDYYTGRQATIDILKKGGFTALVNSHQKITANGVSIQIAGIDDMWAGKPDVSASLRSADQETFTLLLAHCPDFADIAAQSAVDLQLSGHSHGGQVRLPFYGALSTPPHGKKYVKGLYTVGQSRLQVYTNAGIGTSVYPVRFFCRPEITVITLEQYRS